MKKFKIVNFKNSDRSSVKRLIGSSFLYPFRLWEGIDRNKYIDHIVNEIYENRLDLLGTMICKFDNAATGLIQAAISDWDTGYFGIKTARIGHLISGGPYLKTVEIKKCLLKALFEACRKNNIKVLNIRIDLEDISGIRALEDSGFNLIATSSLLVTGTSFA